MPDIFLQLSLPAKAILTEQNEYSAAEKITGNLR
jgi:hypothetical protein